MPTPCCDRSLRTIVLRPASYGCFRLAPVHHLRPGSTRPLARGGRFRSEGSKDLEMVVLRHELSVLRRQVARPRLDDADRVFLAAASRLLPRKNWSAFFVTPETLPTCRQAMDLPEAWLWSHAHRRRPAGADRAPGTGVLAGAICASKGSSTVWASGCPPPRSAECSQRRDSVLRA